MSISGTAFLRRPTRRKRSSIATTRSFNEILAEPNVRALLGKQGLIAQGGPPQRLADLIAKDRPRWAKVVKDAQITAE